MDSPSQSSDSWWESISEARTTIHTLSTLLPQSNTLLLNLADTDRPSFSLLHSFPTYTLLSNSLTGSSSDPLCHFLYDTYLKSSNLRIFVLSYLPVLINSYLTRTHHSPPTSLSGFEAVLLAIYSVETKARNGRPILVQIPDLSQPSLYHSPKNPGVKITNPGVLSPPLEPQNAIKSTKRECIVGVALTCYYQCVSQMPNWSKIDLCKFVTRWAGKDCPCTSDDNEEDNNNNNCVEIVKEEIDERIPMGWELMQPVLRIIGHCLLGKMNGEEVKEEAGVAVRRLYARARHDLVPQAILATRSLVRLDRREREGGKGGGGGEEENVNTTCKVKKPEILLVSK